MAKIIAIANQKGGVGKTTTVINLAAYLGEKNKKVLVVDVDPQGNAGSGLNIINVEEATIYDLIINDVPAAKAIYPTAFTNVSIVPSNQDLSGAQVELVNMIARENKIKQALGPIVGDYDYVLIDTPPSLGLLTLNAFVASHSILIPIQCEYYALEGITQLLKTIKLVKQSLNKNLFIEGVCLTMYDSRTNLSHEVMENIVTHFKEKTYRTIIPRNVKISEAPSHGKPINLYWPDSLGAKAYENLADEFINRNS